MLGFSPLPYKLTQCSTTNRTCTASYGGGDDQTAFKNKNYLLEHQWASLELCQYLAGINTRSLGGRSGLRKGNRISVSAATTTSSHPQIASYLTHSPPCYLLALHSFGRRLSGASGHCADDSAANVSSATFETLRRHVSWAA